MKEIILLPDLQLYLLELCTAMDPPAGLSEPRTEGKLVKDN